MRNKQAELIKKLTDKELLLNLYITQLMMLLVALVLNWIITKNWFSVLNLISWNHKHLWLALGAAIFVVILEVIAAKYLPEHWFDDGGINERMFLKRSPLHIVLISFVVGFSEELLFRGVLQTAFGLIPASIIFALIHFRYLHNIFLFSFTVSLSLFLGIIYMYTDNLLPVIICHMVIDMLLGWMIRFRLIDKIKA